MRVIFTLQENIDIEKEEGNNTPEMMVSLMDKCTDQQLVSTKRALTGKYALIMIHFARLGIITKPSKENANNG